MRTRSNFKDKWKSRSRLGKRGSGHKNMINANVAKLNLGHIMPNLFAKPVTRALTETIKKRSRMAFSLEDLAKLRGKTQRHKFGAKRCEIDDKKFPSLLEARYYNFLKELVKSGEVIFFLRQVAFELPGKVKYVVDFQIFKADGTVEFVDTKGKDTPLSIAKRKIVEELYPITIKIVKAR